uniref:Uncharacterized protein n=1 Tax=Peronospora matthiolae TaxID=2874970 RepID=A0AAV1UV80_9STRA
MGKEPVDKAVRRKWADYRISDGHKLTYPNPDAHEVATLMENKRPEEVVEALTSIQKISFWRDWACDLHRAMASYYLEQNTPEVILTAWLDLDLKPRDLYDDLGFSKEAGGVRDSPEAALMFYKYAELHREEGRDYALSADETVAHMFRNLTPEEASDFLETTSQFVEPGELDELKHELHKLDLVSRAWNMHLGDNKRQRIGSL